MLHKTIYNTWDFGEPACKVEKNFIKCAAWYDKYNIKPEKGYLFVNAIFLGAGEYWGCFTKDSEITISNGSKKKIDTIKVGDEVLTHNLNIKKVTDVFKREYSGNYHTLKLKSSHLTPKATDEHPYRIIKKEEWDKCYRKYVAKRVSVTLEEGLKSLFENVKFDWVKIKDVKKGDKVIVPINTSDEKPLYDISNIPELCGHFLAEGCYVHRNRNGKEYKYRKVVLVSNIKDKEIHNEIINQAKFIGSKTTVRELPEKNSTRLEICNKELCQSLKHYFGEYSQHKKIHGSLLNMPNEWKIRFLSAYLRSDGCIIKAKDKKYDGHVCASTASETLAKDISKMLWSLGIPASTYKDKQRGTKSFGNDIYEINIGKTYASALFDVKNYKNKLNNIYINNNFAYITVKENTCELINETVYNFEVEDDNSYIADDFIVHNCNRNGDYFPEQELIDNYKTFVSHGKHYKHHVNGPFDEYFGEVVAVRYNYKMHRVEGIIKVDLSKKKNKKMVEKIEQGIPVPLSMAAKVPYDECSRCGNRASSLEEYCYHLREEMNKVCDDGVQIYAKNYKPKFFDISEVVKGADSTAYTLEKVASSKKTLQKQSLFDKIAILERLASLEKKIEAILTDKIPISAKALKKESRLRISNLNTDYLSALATEGICISPDEIISNDGFNKIASDLHPNKVYRSILNSPNRDEILESIPVVELGSTSLRKYASDRSLKSEHVVKRLFASIGENHNLIKRSSCNNNNIIKAALINLSCVYSNPSLLEDSDFTELMILQNNFI